ncbi:MAG: metallophosphoesterase [Calditrichae bacterium]|nr:metallophosphoesterase [Calditrichota bacterium]MCB9057491.1 metallophosphoesterase [Calditrichia bacterium]
MLLFSAPLIALFSYVFNTPGTLFIYSENVGWQDYIFYFPFWWGLIFLLESIPYFALVDFVSWLLPKYKHSKYSGGNYNILNKLKLLIVAFFVLYVPIKTHFDTTTIRTTNYTISLENLPDEFDNFSIGLIGDVQVDRYTNNSKLDSFKDKYNKLDSDIVFFAGDIVTSGKTFISEAVDLLCSKKFTFGNFACLGDHDFWADPQSIEQGLVNCGWNFLKDAHQIIEKDSRKILVTGITHIYSQRITAEKAEKLMSEAPAADLKILLVHQPAEFLVQLAAKYNYDIFLAGHTHGGQIVNHFFGIPYAPSTFETSYYRGYYKLNNMQIIVTTGIGLSLAPMRYHAPAEVVNINLTQKQ